MCRGSAPAHLKKERTMEKKIYKEPEMEVTLLEMNQMVLTGSLEEPAIGGSGQGYGDPNEFDPS